jgi:Trm5-related predicted tRNA methylase
MDAGPRQRRPRQAALLGLAFDADDEVKRITRGQNFFLAGGSADTHGQLQETAVKINEHLDRAGKQLADVSIRELRDIVAEIRR